MPTPVRAQELKTVWRWVKRLLEPSSTTNCPLSSPPPRARSSFAHVLCAMIYDWPSSPENLQFHSVMQGNEVLHACSMNTMAMPNQTNIPFLISCRVRFSTVRVVKSLPVVVRMPPKPNKAEPTQTEPNQSSRTIIFGLISRTLRCA